MKMVKLSATTCLRILCLAACTASSAIAETPKAAFDQGVIADGAVEMVTSSAHASAVRFATLNKSPGIDLAELRRTDRSIKLVFRDSRIDRGAEAVIQAEVFTTGPAGIVRATREMRLKSTDSYQIDFGSLDVGSEVLIRHRYKTLSGVPRVVPAHDYTTCNGPSCFSCTHETKCLEKTVKICLRLNPITLQCEYTHEKTWECNPGPGHICSPK